MKYSSAQEEEQASLSRWCRGIFLRTPPVERLELRLRKGDEGEATILSLEKKEISGEGVSGDSIAQEVFAEAVHESQRLGGLNNFCLYLYREGRPRASGHHLFRIECPEDDTTSDSVMRSEPHTEKGREISVFRLFLDNNRQIASERAQLQRQQESIISMQAQTIAKLVEQQLTVIDVTNAALDRKEERAIAVAREKRKDEYQEIAAKQVIPLFGPVAKMLLSKFGGVEIGPQLESLDTKITTQVASFLLSMSSEQVTQFKAILTQDQNQALMRVIALLKRREDGASNLDAHIAITTFNFIYSFSEDQAQRLSTIVSPSQGTAFVELFSDVQKFRETREKYEAAKAAE